MEHCCTVRVHRRETKELIKMCPETGSGACGGAECQGLRDDPSANVTTSVSPAFLELRVIDLDRS